MCWVYTFPPQNLNTLSWRNINHVRFFMPFRMRCGVYWGWNCFKKKLEADVVETRWEVGEKKLSLLLLDWKTSSAPSKSHTYNSRYFTRRLSVALLRVTVNAKFLDFKLNIIWKREETLVKCTTSTAGASKQANKTNICNVEFGFISALRLVNWNYHCTTAKSPSAGIKQIHVARPPSVLEGFCSNVTLFFHYLVFCWCGW